MNWSLRWRSPSKRKSMILPDYSEYLKQPGMLAWIEQEWKANPKMHDEHARIVNEVIETHKLKSVTEVGCGTGEVASRLRVSNYSGFDINDDCIKAAKIKNPHKSFGVFDIRTILLKEIDLVICFGFLKHFGLHEWFDIFKKVSCFGEYFIFDMPIGETKDDGTEFHHVWKSKEDLVIDIDNAGFKLLEIVNKDSVEPIFICKKR